MYRNEVKGQMRTEWRKVTFSKNGVKAGFADLNETYVIMRVERTEICLPKDVISSIGLLSRKFVFHFGC
jgi:hypothetical protein